MRRISRFSCPTSQPTTSFTREHMFLVNEERNMRCMDLPYSIPPTVTGIGELEKGELRAYGGYVKF